MKKLIFFWAFIPQLIFAQSLMRDYQINDSLYRPHGFQAFCKLPGGDLLTASDIWDTIAWPFNSSRVAFVRMDSVGNIRWSKILPQTGSNYSRDISADSSGAYFLNGNNYCSIVRCDTSITPLWMRHITNGPPGFHAYGDVCRTAPGGGCNVIGTFGDGYDIHNMLWAMKFDTAGNVVFSKGYKCTGYSISAQYSAMEMTNDGGMVFPFYISDTTINVYRACGLMKINNTGSVVWSHVYSDTINRVPSAITMLPDSGFVIAGSAYAVSWQPAPYVFLLRTDKLGNIIWCNYYDQLCETRTPIDRQGLTLTKGGNLLYGFTYWQYQGFCNAGELMECTPTGQLISAVRMGGNTSDSIFINQVILSGGKTIASGAKITQVNNNDNNFPICHPLTIVFDSIGNTFCNRSVPVVTTYVTPLTTDQPIITSFNGPSSFNMTLLTLQNTQFVVDSCLISSVENISSANNANVSIYPNPSSGNIILDVHLLNNNSSCNLFLYNASGQLLQTSAIENNTSFTLERKQRPEGIYFIRLVSNNKEVYEGKIIFTN